MWAALSAFFAPLWGPPTPPLAAALCRRCTPANSPSPCLCLRFPVAPLSPFMCNLREGQEAPGGKLAPRDSETAQSVRPLRDSAKHQPSVPPPNALASAPTPSKWSASPHRTTAHRQRRGCAAAAAAVHCPSAAVRAAAGPSAVCPRSAPPGSSASTRSVLIEAFTFLPQLGCPAAHLRHTGERGWEGGCEGTQRSCGTGGLLARNDGTLTRFPEPGSAQVGCLQEASMRDDQDAVARVARRQVRQHRCGARLEGGDRLGGALEQRGVAARHGRGGRDARRYEAKRAVRNWGAELGGHQSRQCTYAAASPATGPEGGPTSNGATSSQSAS